MPGETRNAPKAAAAPTKAIFEVAWWPPRIAATTGTSPASSHRCLPARRGESDDDEEGRPKRQRQHGDAAVEQVGLHERHAPVLHDHVPQIRAQRRRERHRLLPQPLPAERLDAYHRAANRHRRIEADGHRALGVGIAILQRPQRDMHRGDEEEEHDQRDARRRRAERPGGVDREVGAGQQERDDHRGGPTQGWQPGALHQAPGERGADAQQQHGRREQRQRQVKNDADQGPSRRCPQQQGLVSLDKGRRRVHSAPIAHGKHHGALPLSLVRLEVAQLRAIALHRPREHGMDCLDVVGLHAGAQGVQLARQLALPAGRAPGS